MKTLLIGIDGATFHVLDPLIEQGIMPFMGEFCGQGIRSPLQTVIPALTPPAWTSLMTGRSPGRHGVFDFFRLESPESRQIRFATSHDVGCETIWSLVSRQGKRVFTLNFPLMYPAPEINGCVIPGWIPWKLLRFACYPGDLFDRLKSISGLNPRELAMDIKLEEKATEGCRDDEYDDWIRLHIRREENWLRVFRYLMDQDNCDLGAILFDGVDKLQHLCWRFIDPDLSGDLKDWEKRTRDLCFEYFNRLDQIVHELCQYVDSDGQVFIASDHGFGPTQDLFHINTWLEKKGYLKWAGSVSAGHDTESAVLGVGQVARHTYLMDWEQTTAYATTPTSNGVYIVSENGNRRTTGSSYEAIRDDLKEGLLDVRDKASGERIVTEVWSRDEIFLGPFKDLAPDLTLVLRDGGLVSILPSERVLSKRPNVAGAHRPDGVFLARGEGIKENVSLGQQSILDIAPTVLHSLGLGIPSDLEGCVPESVYREEWLQRFPVEVSGKTIARESTGESSSGMDEEEEEAVMERLRELGYIE